MDESLFDTLLSPALIFLCIASYLGTLVIRRVVETIWPSVTESRYYRELFLPICPIINGSFLALLLPSWLPVFVHGATAQIVAGAVAGLLSGALYGRIRSWLKSAKTIPPAE